MKIAVTSQGPHSGSHVDLRFGRALFFFIVDTETGQQIAIETARGGWTEEVDNLTARRRGERGFRL